MRGGTRLLRVLLVALVSVLSAVALMEGALRLGRWQTQRKQDRALGLGSGASPAPRGPRTLVCVGDSWTAGAEVRDPNRESYPARLQALLDRQLGQGRYRVVNLGVMGLGSNNLVRQLTRALDRHRPSMALVFIGGTNWIPIRSLRWRPVPDFESWGPLGRLLVVRLLGTLRQSADTGKGREAYFALDGHPNAWGYAAVARAVLLRLMKLGWLGSPPSPWAP